MDKKLSEMTPKEKVLEGIKKVDKEAIEKGLEIAGMEGYLYRHCNSLACGLDVIKETEFKQIATEMYDDGYRKPKEKPPFSLGCGGDS